MTTAPGPGCAFLFDVDNTLLDNDRVKADFAAGIEAAVGSAAAERFWEIYEDVRRACDYVDYPETIRRFREALPDESVVSAMAELVMNYPYETVLYPGALEVLAKVQVIGPAAIVTDGDPVYQPAEDRARGAGGCRRTAGVRLHPQGAESRRRPRAIPVRSVRPVRRQARPSWPAPSGWMAAC